MAKRFFLIILLLSSLLYAEVYGQARRLPQLSASVRQFLFELEKGRFKEHGLPSQYVYNRVQAGPVLVNAFIKVSPDFQEEQLK